MRQISLKTPLCIMLALTSVATTTVHARGSSATAFQRQHLSINTASWRFIRQDISQAQTVGFNDAAWHKVTIPHDFNGGIDGVHNDVFNGITMYRGIGWYRCNFTVDNQYQGKRIFIDFEAVSLVADVYLNGTHLGQHRGGFTAFTFDITNHVQFGADNLLAVKVSSANDPTIAPWMYDPFQRYPKSYDYSLYGGIYRDVWITISDHIKIEATFNETPGVSAQSSKVRVRTEIKNYRAQAAEVLLKTTLKDPQGATVLTMEKSQTIAAGQTVTIDQTSESIANPRLWSPEEPNLYTVVSAISTGGEQIDAQESPLGFRWFTFANNTSFVLNGRQLFIRGANRHQDIEGFGWALSNQQHEGDAQLLKRLGFNFVRHAHYPADPAFMKACDQLGIMAWIELPWTVSTSLETAFKNNLREQLREMIRQNYNHPSVITWSIGNEYDNAAMGGPYPVHAELNYSYTQQLTAELHTLTKELDPTRPSSSSNIKHTASQDIVDLYSPHTFLGWYGGDYHDYASTRFVSEYGADIGYGVHREPGTEKQGDWSEEYGCLIHEGFVARGEERAASFPGHCVWVLGDFASARVDRVLSYGNTVNYMNQKGVTLNDHTTLKDCAYFYQSMYTKQQSAPMVYIVSHSWKDRWTQPAAKRVWAYSNCDTVELFNDLGTLSLGKRIKNGGEWARTRYQWDSAYVRFNTLYAEGRRGTTVIARDTIILDNLPSPPPLRGVNLALHAPVNASGGTDMANLTDGSIASRWAATPWPISFTIDLGSIKNINVVELFPFSTRAYQYTIATSTAAGEAYVVQVERSANTSGGDILTDSFPAVNARYVRVTTTGADGYTGNWVSYYEARVFGPQSTDALASPQPADLRHMPLRSIQHILASSGSLEELTLTNTRGQTFRLSGETIRPSLDRIPAGIYLLSVRDDRGLVVNTRFIKH